MEQVATHEKSEARVASVWILFTRHTSGKSAMAAEDEEFFAVHVHK